MSQISFDKESKPLKKMTPVHFKEDEDIKMLKQNFDMSDHNQVGEFLLRVSKNHSEIFSRREINFIHHLGK